MNQPVPRKMTRSRSDRWISGVSGGIAQYAGIDANLVRLLFVVLTVVGIGTTALVYVAAWLLMPQEDLQPPTGPPASPPAP